MSADTVHAGQPARAAVAGDVRAEMARRRMTGRELARRTGKSQPYWSRRLSGDVALDVDDLEAVAAHLEVSASDLVRSIGGNPPIGGYGQAPGHEGDEADVWGLAA